MSVYESLQVTRQVIDRGRKWCIIELLQVFYQVFRRCQNGRRSEKKSDYQNVGEQR